MRLKIFASHPVQYHVPFYRALLDAGADVDVMFYHRGTAGQRALDEEFGISIEWDLDLLSGYPYHIGLDGRATYSLAEQLRLVPGLAKRVLGARHVPLLLMGWSSELAWLTWLLRVVTRSPIIILSETTPQSFSLRPKPFWRVQLLHWLILRTQAVLFIGQRNRQFYETIGVPAQKLFYTPYSVDNARFAEAIESNRPRTRELRQSYGLDPELPVFLFCGKLIPKKRPLELLGAFLQAGLQDQAQLVYVGEGQLRPEIEARASAAEASHVHCLGFFNQSQMPLAYLLGDLFCLLSGPDETWGLVVNEAAVCGVPMILSDAVGCGPDLLDERNGWVVPLDDPDRLAATLVEAYNRRDEWPIMGSASKQRVSSHTYDEMTAGVLLALRHLEKEKQRGKQQ